MIFNIHHDSGDLVAGTVIPDSYSGVCRIRVLTNDQEVANFPTFELNSEVRKFGFHETGLVDFSISEQSLPGLSKLDDLELREADSNLLLYRRFRPGMIQKKFLRLETQLSPLWRLDESIKHRFQQYYRGIETLGRSGTTQIFHLNQKSIYASGRIQFKNFLHSIDNGFQIITMIRDPYEELAERLVLLNGLQKNIEYILGEREIMILRAAIEFARGLPIKDEKAVLRALKRMPLDVALSLANPIVRQLSTTTPDEQPRASGVAVALDVLAQSALVGLLSESTQFTKAFGELVGHDLGNTSFFPRSAKVNALAQAIRASGSVESILEKDLELFANVRYAFQKANAAEEPATSLGVARRA